MLTCSAYSSFKCFVHCLNSAIGNDAVCPVFTLRDLFKIITPFTHENCVGFNLLAGAADETNRQKIPRFPCGVLECILSIARRSEVCDIFGWRILTSSQNRPLWTLSRNDKIYSLDSGFKYRTFSVGNYISYQFTLSEYRSYRTIDQAEKGIRVKSKKRVTFHVTTMKTREAVLAAATIWHQIQKITIQKWRQKSIFMF